MSPVPFVAVLFAGLFGATILCRRFVAHARNPRGLMVFLILVVLFLELPVHVAGILEAFELVPSVSPELVLALAIAVLTGVVVAVGIHMFTHERRLIQDVLPGARQAGVQEWDSPDARPERFLRICVALAALALTLFFVEMLTRFPAGWDARSYHLPNVVRWLQQETLSIPETLDWRYALPGNAEVIAMFMLGAGWERLATAGNLVAFTVLVCGSWSISRRFGPDSAALASSLIVGTLPIVVFQAFSGYVDLFGTAFIVGGLALFLDRDSGLFVASSSRSSLLTLLLAGSALGLSIGTKPVLWPYAAMFVSAACFVLMRSRNSRSIMPVLALLAGVSIPSVFWFLRAGLATGNPFFPIPVELAGHELLPGIDLKLITPLDYDRQYVRSTAEWFVYPWTEFMRTGYAYGTGSGLGALWATFVPIGFLFGAWKALRHPEEVDRRLIWLLLVIFVLAVLWWFDLRRMLRFGLPFLVLACITTTPYLAALWKRRSILLRVSFMGALGVTLVLMSWVPLHALLGRLRTWNWTRNQVYAYPSLIDDWPRRTVVWNRTVEPMNYPLSGCRLSNIVIPNKWTESLRAEDAIDRFGIDYVIEFGTSMLPPVASAQLTFEGEVANRHWIIWHVSGVGLYRENEQRPGIAPPVSVDTGRARFMASMDRGVKCPKI